MLQNCPAIAFAVTLPKTAKAVLAFEVLQALPEGLYFADIYIKSRNSRGLSPPAKPGRVAMMGKHKNNTYSLLLSIVIRCYWIDTYLWISK